MTLKELLSAIKLTPKSIDFNDVMDVIQENYRYQETEFMNGLGDSVIVNAAGTNEGSCKTVSYTHLTLPTILLV